MCVRVRACVASHPKARDGTDGGNFFSYHKPRLGSYYPHATTYQQASSQNHGGRRQFILCVCIYIYVLMSMPYKAIFVRFLNIPIDNIDWNVYKS